MNPKVLYSLLGRITWMIVKRRLASGAGPLSVVPIVGAALALAGFIARRRRASGS